MLLYHGTTEAFANAALNQGILPRDHTKSKGNWKHTANSRPDCVYLTTVYAGYFAGCATRTGRWGIIEVDTDLIEETAMLPDEDYMEQSTTRRPVPNLPGPYAALRKANAIKDNKARMIARTRWFRKHLTVFQDQWKNSIIDLGNCAVYGGVPASAITRVSFFNHRSNQFVANCAINPMISVMNYMIMGAQYRELTKWFMGERVDYKAFGPFFDEKHENSIREMLLDTSGLEVVTINQKKEKMLGG